MDTIALGMFGSVVPVAPTGKCPLFVTPLPTRIARSSCGLCSFLEEKHGLPDSLFKQHVLDIEE